MAGVLQPYAGIMGVIRHILVPTDFEEPSFGALCYAARLARALGAQLSVLHVQPQGGSPIGQLLGGARAARVRKAREEEQAERLHRKLERFARSVPRIDELRVRLVVRTGSPGAEIAACAAGDNLDLIVLGTRRPVADLPHRLAGGTAETVLRLAGCPVLVLRDEDAIEQVPAADPLLETAPA